MQRVSECPLNAMFLFSLSTMDDRSLYLPTAGARAASVKFLLIIVGGRGRPSRKAREHAVTHLVRHSFNSLISPAREISQTFPLIGEFK